MGGGQLIDRPIKMATTPSDQLTAIADHLTRRVVAGNQQRLP
jgi:hypothetical protein